MFYIFSTSFCSQNVFLGVNSIKKILGKIHQKALSTTQKRFKLNKITHFFTRTASHQCTLQQNGETRDSVPSYWTETDVPMLALGTASFLSTAPQDQGTFPLFSSFQIVRTHQSTPRRRYAKNLGHLGSGVRGLSGV